MRYSKQQKEIIQKLLKKTYNCLCDFQIIYFDDDIKFQLITEVILKFNTFTEGVINEIQKNC